MNETLPTCGISWLHPAQDSNVSSTKSRARGEHAKRASTSVKPSFCVWKVISNSRRPCFSFLCCWSTALPTEASCRSISLKITADTGVNEPRSQLGQAGRKTRVATLTRTPRALHGLELAALTGSAPQDSRLAPSSSAAPWVIR